jgi:hypothetical protein
MMPSSDEHRVLFAAHAAPVGWEVHETKSMERFWDYRRETPIDRVASGTLSEPQAPSVSLA